MLYQERGMRLSSSVNFVWRGSAATDDIRDPPRPAAVSSCGRDGSLACAPSGAQPLGTNGPCHRGGQQRKDQDDAALLAAATLVLALSAGLVRVVGLGVSRRRAALVRAGRAWL